MSRLLNLGRLSTFSIRTGMVSPNAETETLVCFGSSHFGAAKRPWGTGRTYRTFEDEPHSETNVTCGKCAWLSCIGALDWILSFGLLLFLSASFCCSSTYFLFAFASPPSSQVQSMLTSLEL